MVLKGLSVQNEKVSSPQPAKREKGWGEGPKILRRLETIGAEQAYIVGR